MEGVVALLLGILSCSVFIYSRVYLLNMIKLPGLRLKKQSKEKMNKLIYYCIFDCACYVSLLAISTFVIVKKLNNPASILLGINNIYFQNTVNIIGLSTYIIMIIFGIKSIWEVSEIVHESIKRRSKKFYRASKPNRNAADC